MKKIFEFKTFDVVNNPDNQEFLRKVRDQNPNLYSRFVSLIGNKGLEVAKDKYKDYDPDYWKIRNKQLEKKKKQVNKEKRKEIALEILAPQITMINAVLKISPLKKDIQMKIEKGEFEVFSTRFSDDMSINIHIQPIKAAKFISLNILI